MLKCNDMFAFKFHDSLHFTEKGDFETIYCKRNYEYQLILRNLWWLFIISKMKYSAEVRFTKVVNFLSYSSLSNASIVLWISSFLSNGLKFIQIWVMEDKGYKLCDSWLGINHLGRSMDIFSRGLQWDPNNGLVCILMVNVCLCVNWSGF